MSLELTAKQPSPSSSALPALIAAGRGSATLCAYRSRDEVREIRQRRDFSGEQT
jgi:hypothetical protein